ncbi:hypothetical protein ACFE04_026094 [Oxalis oulophora]
MRRVFLGIPEDPKLAEASPSGENITTESLHHAEVNEVVNQAVVEASLFAIEPSSLAKISNHSKKRKDMAKGKTNKSSKDSHQKVDRLATPTSTNIELTPSIESNADFAL